jgi:hypothetical protein
MSGDYTSVGSYWERGNRNEIDIVAFNDIRRKILLAEVKMKKENFRPALLRESARSLISRLGDYQVEYRSLSLDDI